MERRSDPPGHERGDDGRLGSSHLLGHRLYVHCGVRAVVAATIVVAGFFARHVLGMSGIDPGALTVLALFILAYDAVAWRYFRRYRETDVPAPTTESLLGVAYCVVVLDFLALTGAIWLVGGCRSPFVAFYLLHGIINTILLSRRWALILMGFAYSLLALLVLGELTGIAPPRLPAGAIAGYEPLGGRFALTILVVYGMLFGLTAFLLLGVTRALRSGERRIQMANAELTRVSEQRRDFLHIAIHNLKAPLGAVTMFLENMRRGLAGPVSEKQEEWLGRSLKRLGDLSSFMSEMQTLSSVETDIIPAKFERVDLTEILENLVREHRDVAQENDRELRLQVTPPVPPVIGHARLLREAVVNYITNAIKYSSPGGRIDVRLFYRAPHVRIEVADQGPGISREDRMRLFGEFVRVREPDLASTTFKGSGLGLSIVKRIASAHGGCVGVESETGSGSTFYIELPPLFE